MELVGAPLAYVRGPFVVEGILQGGAGALAGDAPALGRCLRSRGARYGQAAAESIGLGHDYIFAIAPGPGHRCGGDAARVPRVASSSPAGCIDRCTLSVTCRRWNGPR